jgi:transcriptional regulator with PAS, ATPase and Fis domain
MDNSSVVPGNADSASAEGALQALEEENRRLREEIDERRKFASILQRRIDFLNLIVESVPFPLYVIDTADYKIQIANAAAKTGRLAAEVTCHALTHGSATPCSSKGHPCPLRSVVHSKHPVVVEHVHLDDTNRKRDVRVHAFPILDADGEVVQMVEFCLDVTDQRKAERECDRVTAQLRDLNGTGA